MAQGTNPMNLIEVSLELGQTRTFAIALDWPGWCRSGRDEASALQALYDYGHATRVRFGRRDSGSALRPRPLP